MNHHIHLPLLREVKELVVSLAASKRQSQESDPVLFPLFTVSVTPLNWGTANAAKPELIVEEEKEVRLRPSGEMGSPTVEIRTDFSLSFPLTVILGKFLNFSESHFQTGE